MALAGQAKQLSVVLTASERAEGLGNCRGPASWLPPVLGRGVGKASSGRGKGGCRPAVLCPGYCTALPSSSLPP